MVQPKKRFHNYGVLIKTASKVEQYRDISKGRCLECKSNMKFFNILLAQHNKFQYNARERTRRAWKMIYCREKGRRTEPDLFLGRCSSIFEESSPFRIRLLFEFNLEQTVQLDLTCALWQQ